MASSSSPIYNVLENASHFANNYLTFANGISKNNLITSSYYYDTKLNAHAIHGIDTTVNTHATINNTNKTLESYAKFIN